MAASLAVMGLLLLPPIRFESKTLTPLTIAEVHHTLQAGGMGLAAVSNWQQAADLLASRWPEGPRLPLVDSAGVVNAGIYYIKGRRLIGIGLRYRDRPVSLLVSGSYSAPSPWPVSNLSAEADYSVESIGDLRVAIAEKGGVQVYLVAHRSVEPLLELADSLRF